MTDNAKPTPDEVLAKCEGLHAKPERVAVDGTEVIDALREAIDQRNAARWAVDDREQGAAYIAAERDRLTAQLKLADALADATHRFNVAYHTKGDHVPYVSVHVELQLDDALAAYRAARETEEMKP